MTRLRAAVFSRESRGKLTSIDDQDRLNTAVAEGLNADVLHMLRDKVSASRFGTKARAGWPDVAQLVTGDRIDLLIVYEISRSDRVMDTWVPFLSACRDHGVLIHVTSEETTYDPRRAVDRKRLLDAGADAEYETERLSKRTRKGTEGAALAGKPHGKPGFGYSRRYDPRDRKVFRDEPNEHAPVAREIIERVASREPVSAITDDLNRRGAADRQWSRKAVKLIAANPRYAGKRVHKGAEYDAAWPAIVDEATFRRAVAVLSEPGRKQSAPGALRFLLSYIAVCSKCGEVLNVNAYRSRARPRYKCAKGHQSVDLEAADAVAASAVYAMRYRTDVFEALGGDRGALAAADGEVLRIRHQLDEWRGALDDELISPAAFGIKERKLLDQLADAERALDKARQANEAMTAFDELIGDDDESEQAAFDAFLTRWSELTLPRRRMLIKACFARIELHPPSRRLHAHSTWEDRVALAVERIRFVLPGEQS